jgi:DNA polymerase-3 subunit gamma/tau
MFRLIAVEEIQKKLREAATEEGTVAEEEALFWIAKEATGSLRDAYTLFDQVSSFSGGNITFELIKEKLGTVGLDGINEIVELLLDGKIVEALGILDEAMYRGVSVEQFVLDLAEYFRCLLFIRLGTERESLLGYKKERFSKKALELLSDKQIEKGLEIIFQLYRDLRYSLNQRFELELVLSRLSALSSYISQADIIKKVVQLKNEISGTVSSEGEQTGLSHSDPRETKLSHSGAEPTKHPNTGDVSNEMWESITSAIRNKHLSLASSLEKVRAWRVEGESIVLTCDSSYAAAHIKREGKKLQESAAAVLGKSYAIVVEENHPSDVDSQADETTENGVEMIR